MSLPDPYGAQWQAEIERRMAALERSPRLPNTSQRGGAYELISESGRVMFRFGEFTDPDTGSTEFGVSVYDKNGSVVFAIAESEEGWLWPQQYYLWTAPTPTTVTSGTFVSIYEGTIDSFNADTLNTEMAAACAVGTTGEVRLGNSAGTITTTAVTVPSGGNGTVGFNWLHPYRVGWGDTTASSGGDLLQIQARRVSGAGSFLVYPPRKVKTYNKRFPTGEATTGGGFFV